MSNFYLNKWQYDLPLLQDFRSGKLSVPTDIFINREFAESLLIDMGEVGYGHPIVDLGHSYSAMMALVGNYEQIIGIPEETCKSLWSKMIRYYFEGESEDYVKHRIEQIEVVGCVRNFTWLSLSNSFPDEVIRTCQQLFEERITKRKDHILAVCDTFNDWKL